MKLEAGKFYKTRDGRRAFVAFVGCPFKTNVCEWDDAVGWVETDGDLQFRDSWRADGKAVPGENAIDLIAEWKEPKRIRGWLSLYRNDHGDIVGYHDKDRETADRKAGNPSARLACIEMDCLEGEGL